MNILCSICTEIFTGQENQTISSTICGHVFHYHCIIQWIEKAKTCPICRKAQTINRIMKLNLHLEGNLMEVSELKESCKIATKMNEELRLENQMLKDENVILKNQLEVRSNADHTPTIHNNYYRQEDKDRLEMKEAILNSAVDRVTQLEKKVLELEQENDKLRQMYFT